VILSIDITSEFGSIALTEANVVMEEIALHAPEGFGHVLFGHIEELLERNGTTVHQMECFAAASGPGSFTGVRVGLAAAKGLAEATGKRMVAVSNLRAPRHARSHFRPAQMPRAPLKGYVESRVDPRTCD